MKARRLRELAGEPEIALVVKLPGRTFEQQLVSAEAITDDINGIFANAGLQSVRAEVLVEYSYDCSACSMPLNERYYNGACHCAHCGAELEEVEWT